MLFFQVAIIALLFVTFLLVAKRQDEGRLPVLDVGAFVMLSTAVYSTVPAIQWLANGQKWSYVSDRRLLLGEMGTADLEQYLTGAIVYLICFSIVYLAIRGRGTRWQSPPAIYQSQVVAILAICIGCLVFRYSVESIYSFNYYQRASDLQYGGSTRNLPLLIQQLTHHIVDIGRDATLALTVILIAFWKRPAARVLLAVLFCYEITDIVLRQGQRTSLVLLLIGATLAFHRCVKPFTFTAISVVTASGLGLAIIYGIYRDINPMYKFDVSFSNEFQVLFGTFAHLKQLLHTGKIAEVPWQIYASDPLMLIPQQILPVQKIDPSLWYIEKANLAGSGGFMFGVMAEGVVGGGYLELAARGIALATVLGLIHRAFDRRNENFWMLVFYIWLCTVIYYSFRASTFYWLTFLVFQFLPLFLFSQIISLVWKRGFSDRRIQVGTPEVSRV